MGLNKYWKKVGENIKEARLDRNMSQSDLARRLKIKSGPVFISLIESGRSKVPPKQYKRMSRLLNLGSATDDLVTRAVIVDYWG